MVNLAGFPSKILVSTMEGAFREAHRKTACQLPNEQLQIVRRRMNKSKPSIRAPQGMSHRLRWHRSWPLVATLRMGPGFSTGDPC